jgi:hypothetical protein
MSEEIEKVPTYMLTTIDNPFHPLNEYDDWLRFDEDHGYYTWNYIARVAGTSDYLSDAENQRAINSAIDDIIRLDLQCIYKKILVDDQTDDE